MDAYPCPRRAVLRGHQGWRRSSASWREDDVEQWYGFLIYSSVRNDGDALWQASSMRKISELRTSSCSLGSLRSILNTPIRPSFLSRYVHSPSSSAQGTLVSHVPLLCREVWICLLDTSTSTDRTSLARWSPLPFVSNAVLSPQIDWKVSSAA